jgi:hypothetical protein
MLANAINLKTHSLISFNYKPENYWIYQKSINNKRHKRVYSYSFESLLWIFGKALKAQKLEIGTFEPFVFQKKVYPKYVHFINFTNSKSIVLT